MDKEILNKAQQWLDGNYDEKNQKGNSSFN
jgi:hypothetical protein